MQFTSFLKMFLSSLFIAKYSSRKLMTVFLLHHPVTMRSVFGIEPPVQVNPAYLVRLQKVFKRLDHLVMKVPALVVDYVLVSPMIKRREIALVYYAPSQPNRFFKPSYGNEIIFNPFPDVITDIHLVSMLA